MDWDAAWQRHHALASACTASGAEVFFVENTGFRGLQPGDLGRVFHRLRRMVSRSPRKHTHRILAPLTLPPTSRLFRTLNAVYFIPLLLKRLHRMGLRQDPVVFAYLPTATTLGILDALSPPLVVYDCVDNFHGHPTPPSDLKGTERELLDRSDLVLTTSSYLRETLEPHHPRVREVHHGVSEAFFAPPRPPLEHFRRLCYFGTVWSAVDFDSLRALAEAGFEVTLLGPVKEPPPPLPANVLFRASLPHDELPAALQEYDALLLPYGDTPYNKGVVPAKLYECLATGKPVLASPIPSLRPYSDLLYMAEGPAKFVQAARELPRTETPERIALRIETARAHSTPAQFALIESMLREAFSLGHLKTRKSVKSSAQVWMESFLQGFSWIAVFFAAARMMTLLTQFLAAHFLGPSEYGRAHFIIAVASIVQILPLLGFPLALARHGASHEDEAGRRRIVATAATVFALWLLSCTALAGFSARYWAPLTGLATSDWVPTAAYGVIMALYLVLGSTLQGLGKFKLRGTIEALYGLFSIAALAIFLSNRHRHAEALIYSFVAGLGAATLYGFWLLRSYIRPRLDLQALRGMLPFILLGTLSVVATAFTQAPGRIAVFHYRSAWEAGVYSVYFTTTAQISLALIFMSHTVLIPLASQPDGQREAWRLLRRWTLPALPLLAAFFTASAVLAVALLKKNYPMHIDCILLFSLSAATIFVHGTYAAIFAARDVRGLLVSVSGSLAAGGGNLVLNLVLTPRWGLCGAAASLALGYMLGLAWYLLRIPAETSR